MLPEYETDEEIQMRLYQSVIMFGENPVYCIEARINRLGLCSLPYDDEVVGEYVPPDHPELNAHQFNLGYMNVDPAQFIYRLPVRKFKQGLTAQNICLPQDKQGRKFTFPALIRMKPFQNMLMNKYPNYQQTLMRVIHDEKSSQAFSKHSSISGLYRGGELTRLELNWRGRKVGVSDVHDNPVFKLSNNSKYLKEVFENDGVRIQ